jgi:hypothetical protein
MQPIVDLFGSLPATADAPQVVFMFIVFRVIGVTLASFRTKLGNYFNYLYFVVRLDYFELITGKYLILKLLNTHSYQLFCFAEYAIQIHRNA